MPISGLSHITFVVRDLERARTLWCDGLGAQEVYDSADRTFSLSREKFFMLAGIWIAVMEGEPGTRTYRHVAFQVPEDEIKEYEPEFAHWALRFFRLARECQVKANHFTSMTSITTCWNCTAAR